MLTNIVELWKEIESDEYIFYFLRNRGSERDVSEVRKSSRLLTTVNSLIENHAATV